nr:MAG TPA: hypothetical protein [Crassvirales sp.]
MGAHIPSKHCWWMLWTFNPESKVRFLMRELIMGVLLRWWMGTGL